MNSGKFWYFGLKNCLLQKFSDLDNSTTISVLFNIDGLPIFNSAKTEFWPILCISNYSKFSTPMPIAVYWGQTKPSLQNFVNPFVDELRKFWTMVLQLVDIKSQLLSKALAVILPHDVLLKVISII